jgi:hypothetical protein
MKHTVVMALIVCLSVSVTALAVTIDDGRWTIDNAASLLLAEIA